MTLTLWSFGLLSLIRECFCLRLNVLYVLPERAEAAPSWATYRQLFPLASNSRQVSFISVGRH